MIITKEITLDGHYNVISHHTYNHLMDTLAPLIKGFKADGITFHIKDFVVAEDVKAVKKILK